MQGVIGTAPSVQTTAPQTRHETILFTGGWEAAQAQVLQQSPREHEPERWIILSNELPDDWSAKIDQEIPNATRIPLGNRDLPLEDQLQLHARGLLERIQAHLSNRPRNQLLIQLIINGSERPERRQLWPLASLLNVAALENTRIHAHTIGLHQATTLSQLLQELRARRPAGIQSQVRHDGSKWLAYAWQEMAGARAMSASVPWKDGGVYLIAGGTGGLGKIVATDVFSATRNAVVVLAGRSASDTGGIASARLAANGGRIEYRRIDVSNALDVAVQVARIVKECGALDGVIHAAGVRNDGYLFSKTKESLANVFAPKIAGCVNLDAATRHIKLDCFVMFSSVAAILGNVGQVDYATANAFLDHYADYRQSLVATGERFGRTLSINWPLWAEGGMGVDAASLAHRRHQGRELLETRLGLRAFYRALASGSARVAVLAGEPDKLRKLLTNPS